jgi:phosphoenolpyruvate-protein phosphotransferase
MLILDGESGQVLVDPDQPTIDAYKTRQREEAALMEKAFQEVRQPAMTLDGKVVEVVANIGQVSEAALAVEQGAEGVGLLRTEFLYLDRTTAPGEDEQYENYLAIAQAFDQLPVVIRTLDIGGDKQLPYVPQEPEDNPFLGLRGLRLCLAMPELLKCQLRAILRASLGHNLKIMFPMVSTLSEIRQARQVLAEARSELDERHVPYAEVEVGMMVEVPAAAVAADLLAPHVDFFSIGTNDLTQYTLAADRTNQVVQSLADAFHPAVLRLIDATIRAGHAAGIWVGLCGELAGDPQAVPLLLGMHLDEFSMGKASIPLVKQTIRRWSGEQCEQIARQALQLEDAQAVREYLHSLA